MMDITLRDVWVAGQVIRNLQTNTQCPNCGTEVAMRPRIKAKASYRLGKVLDEFQKVNERKDELVQKYGEDDGSGQVQVTDENWDEFLDEFEDLLDEEVELKVKPVTLDMLGDAEISPAEMANLGPFIAEEEE